MSRKKSFITVTDQFCGAGGSSIGATKAGAELRGHDLVCWCRLDEPCHADALLRISNE